MRGSGHEYRHVQLLCERCQAMNVIGVLVGDQNGRQAARLQPNRLQPLKSLAAGQAGINQNTCQRSLDDGAVPTASARQHRDRYTHVRSIHSYAVEVGVTLWLSRDL